MGEKWGWRWREGRLRRGKAFTEAAKEAGGLKTGHRRDHGGAYDVMQAQGGARTAIFWGEQSIRCSCRFARRAHLGLPLPPFAAVAAHVRRCPPSVAATAREACPLRIQIGHAPPPTGGSLPAACLAPQFLGPQFLPRASAGTPPPRPLPRRRVPAAPRARRPGRRRPAPKAITAITTLAAPRPAMPGRPSARGHRIARGPGLRYYTPVP